jgi:hypothetical protein
MKFKEVMVFRQLTKNSNILFHIAARYNIPDLIIKVK